MEKSPAFEDVFGAFMDLYNEGRTSEAQTLLETHAPAYPEWDALIRMWEISLLARSGETGSALAKLGAALEAGIWYHEDALTNDPDLQALAELPAYQPLVAQSAALRMASLEQAQAVLEVHRPDGSGPQPLLVAFHGNNNSIAASRSAWLSAVDCGWTLALPQSSQPSWLSGFYNWNFPEALDQVSTQIAGLRATQGLQAGPVVAGGFSMGAALALRLGMEGKQPISAVIAVEPWVPDPASWPPIIAECPLPGPRFFLVGGRENSENFEALQWLDELLRTAGFSSTVIATSNTRHRIPDEFAAILADILAGIE